MTAAARLPVARFDAVIFDMDGVVTQTATVHARAWKQLFDEYLRERAGRGGGVCRPFDIYADYRRYLDGKPRYDGVRDFLASRGISLPWGDPADPPGAGTVCALGNRKDDYFRRRLAAEGAEAFATTVEFVRGLRRRGVRTGVFSASKNAGEVLEAAGVAGLFEVRVDGEDAEKLRLAGKPAPDQLLETAARLGASPGRTAVIEDAIAGVQAGRAGRFGLVIGVNRSGERGILRRNGADVELRDLAELAITDD